MGQLVLAQKTKNIWLKRSSAIRFQDDSDLNMPRWPGYTGHHWVALEPFIGDDDMRHEYVIGAMVGVLGINLALGVTCVILICMGYTEIHLNVI